MSLDKSRYTDCQSPIGAPPLRRQYRGRHPDLPVEGFRDAVPGILRLKRSSYAKLSVVLSAQKGGVLTAYS